MSSRDKAARLTRLTRLTRTNSVVSGDLSTAINVISNTRTEQGIFHAVGLAPAAPRWLTNLPFVWIPLQGFIFFREAWLIHFDDPNNPRFDYLTDKEREFHKAVALTGGFIAVGAFIVKMLLEFHVGLLATASAATIAPIIITCVGIAFYCMTLMRDFWRLQEINLDLSEQKNNPSANIEIIKKLKKSRWALIADMIFSFIGTLGTILLLSASIIGLTVSTGGLSSLFIGAGALVAVSTTPGIIAVSKMLLNLPGFIWSRLKRQNQAPTPKNPHESCKIPLLKPSLETSTKRPLPLSAATFKNIIFAPASTVIDEITKKKSDQPYTPTSVLPRLSLFMPNDAEKTKIDVNKQSEFNETNSNSITFRATR